MQWSEYYGCTCVSQTTSKQAPLKRKQTSRQRDQTDLSTVEDLFPGRECVQHKQQPFNDRQRTSTQVPLKCKQTSRQRDQTDLSSVQDLFPGRKRVQHKQQPFNDRQRTSTQVPLKCKQTSRQRDQTDLSSIQDLFPGRKRVQHKQQPFNKPQRTTTLTPCCTGASVWLALRTEGSANHERQTTLMCARPLQKMDNLDASASKTQAQLFLKVVRFSYQASRPLAWSSRH